MGVYGESSGQIPVGEEVKIVCYAVDSNNDPYYQIETITVEDSQSFNISLTKGTEASFTSALDGL